MPVNIELTHISIDIPESWKGTHATVSYKGTVNGIPIDETLKVKDNNYVPLANLLLRLTVEPEEISNEEPVSDA